LATGFQKDKCTSELIKFINHENFPVRKNAQRVILIEVWKNNVGLSVYKAEEFKYGFNMRFLNGQPKVNPQPTEAKRQGGTIDEKNNKEYANKKMIFNESLKSNSKAMEDAYEKLLWQFNDSQDKIDDELANRRNMLKEDISKASQIPEMKQCNHYFTEIKSEVLSTTQQHQSIMENSLQITLTLFDLRKVLCTEQNPFPKEYQQLKNNRSLFHF